MILISAGRLYYNEASRRARKSSSRSLLVLAEKMGIPAEETAFVGDEIKDMQCAKGAGAKAVLINRTGETKDYGQDGEITDLREISRMI